MIVLIYMSLTAIEFDTFDVVTHLLYTLLGEGSVQDFYPVSLWVVCFLTVKF